MKNSKNIFLLVLMSVLVLTSCGNPGNNTESESKSPSDTETEVDTETSTDTESESDSDTESEYIPENTLEAAILNSTEYSLRSTSSGKYFETVQDDFYYSSTQYGGFIVLDNDPNYFHAFDILHVEDSETDFYDTFNVYGRTFRRNQLSQALGFSFLTIVYHFRDLFTQVNGNENRYYSTSPDLTYVFSEFFQQKIIGDCNLFEIDIENNRLKQMRFIETYQESGYYSVTLSCDITQDDGTQIPAYQKWVELGKKESIRILDVKQLLPSLSNSSIPVSPYENETVQISATVSAFDLNKGFYVTQNNDNYGPIGLQVITNQDYSSLKIGDVINLTGTVVTESKTDINTYLNNATYTVSEEPNSLPPIYDEDYMVDAYGGGTYAAVMFSTNPMFGGSIYSTFGYVYDIPANLNLDSDTVITFICPNIVDLQGKMFYFDLILSAELDFNFRISLFNTLQDAGVFTAQTGVSSAKELSLENMLIDYNFSPYISHPTNRGNYPVSLVALENSSISNKKNVVEKIESYFGLSNFPLASSNSTSYRFGGVSGLFIESVYGDYLTKEKTGLFVAFEGITQTIFDTYVDLLITYGLTKYDEIKDVSRERHTILTKNDVVVDLTFDAKSNAIQCWIYTSPIIRMASIEEQLQAKIGTWFDVESDFIRMTGTYDADYSLVDVYSYAGNNYENSSPITVVTLDLQEDVLTDYRRLLVTELGYKQYRDENNKPASYKVRGSSHTGFYKQDKNIFIDIAVYPTSDYTYTGHSEFQYRIELVISQGVEPIEITTYDSLEPLALLQKARNERGYYNPTLPSDAVVELWTSTKDLNKRDVYYGYGSRDEAFVYTSDVNGAFDAVVASLVEAGYVSWGGTSNVYVLQINENTTLHVCLLKDTTNGYLRVMNELGGVDFWK